MKVELEWITPNVEQVISKMARVSNPKNENNFKTAPKLLRYLIRNKHWSPFEMGNACVYIECPRDISRQVLRHRSFSFQEFSGRYAEYDGLSEEREVRMLDEANRQNSLPCTDDNVRSSWRDLVEMVRSTSEKAYKSALDLGIAKEVARVLLPEGLTPTRMYMNGTIRSWIHYWDVRCDPSTQKEHQELAKLTKAVILEGVPKLRELLEGGSRE